MEVEVTEKATYKETYEGTLMYRVPLEACDLYCGALNALLPGSQGTMGIMIRVISQTLVCQGYC